jgi:hypothetical protein
VCERSTRLTWLCVCVCAGDSIWLSSRPSTPRQFCRSAFWHAFASVGQLMYTQCLFALAAARAWRLICLLQCFTRLASSARVWWSRKKKRAVCPCDAQPSTTAGLWSSHRCRARRLGCTGDTRSESPTQWPTFLPNAHTRFVPVAVLLFSFFCTPCLQSLDRW